MTTHEVQLAIYDLSNGMARSLSTQFLGPNHAIDILPHTALLVYGKEYFFGQGIEWCAPHIFRATRGIHPIEIQSLGHTTRTVSEFEEWCRHQGNTHSGGKFGRESYDLLTRNCNNFSHDAALEGLRLGRGVPQWILDVPNKFMSSPMGMMVRPILEQMQITNSAPTNVGGGVGGMGAPSPDTTAAPPAATAASNPWANIPSSTTTTTTTTATTPPATTMTTKAPTPASNATKSTPLLDKQTGPLLSTDTNVVRACVSRLFPDKNDTTHQREVLSKLANEQATWTKEGLASIHEQLITFIESGTDVSIFALMLLRLVVLRQPTPNENITQNNNTISEKSINVVMDMILDDNNNYYPLLRNSATTKSMSWCVLGNAVGSKNPPTWMIHQHHTSNEHSEDGRSEKFLPLIDKALNDCNPSSVDASSSSSQANVSLRQSASAFLYNVSRSLAVGDDYYSNTNANADPNSDADADDSGREEMSEATMAILIGCLENLKEEKDVTTLTRRLMCIGQLLKSKKFGKTAVELVRDLGLMEETENGGGGGGGGGADGLAKEVALLLES